MPVRCALALLDLRQELLAVAAEVAQFVEFAIDARANHAAIAQGNRRLGDNRLVDARRADRSSSSIARADCCSLSPERRATRIAHCRNLRQRCSQRQHIARIRRFQRDPAEQTLQIKNSFQRAPQFLARDRCP